MDDDALCEPNREFADAKRLMQGTPVMSRLSPQDHQQ